MLALGLNARLGVSWAVVYYCRLRTDIGLDCNCPGENFLPMRISAFRCTIEYYCYTRNACARH